METSASGSGRRPDRGDAVPDDAVPDDAGRDDDQAAPQTPTGPSNQAADSAGDGTPDPPGAGRSREDYEPV